MSTALKVTVVKGISTPYHELNMFKVLFILTHAFACGQLLNQEEILAELPEKYVLNNGDDMLACIKTLEERGALWVTVDWKTNIKRYILRESLDIAIYLNHLGI